MTFKVGDRVTSKTFGAGTVRCVDPSKDKYNAVTVQFDEDCFYGTFSLEGVYCDEPVEDVDIFLLYRSDDPEEMLKKHNAVNPDHYNVPGVQQPIEVMKKLMTKEQFEGFLWGNIIKYAHRYGRKGDKKETAGKIAQYAKWLEEVAD